MRTQILSTLLAVSLFGLVLSSAPSCAKAPPNLSPSGVAAWRKTQIVKQLDILRDTVIQANALTPPLVSTDVTRQVVLAHKSILLTIQASEVGWQAVVSTSLDALVANLPPASMKVIKPYVVLIKTILQEIP